MRISDWSSDVCSSDLLNISRTGKRGLVLDSTRIGQIVRDERKELGLRQDELAAASGVGLRFIVDLERGKATAQIGKVITVLAALGCELPIRRPDGIVIARSEEHTSELQSLMRISYAVFCLQKK